MVLCKGSLSALQTVVFLLCLHIWALRQEESWITFELQCRRRLLRVPWTVRSSNGSILKEINPEYSLEEFMLKLKLQYFDHLMGRTDSLLKTLILGKIEGRRRRGDRGGDGWMASSTQWTWVWVNSGSWWWTGRPGVLQSMGSQRVGHNWVTELTWTETKRVRQKSVGNGVAWWKEPGTSMMLWSCWINQPSHFRFMFQSLRNKSYVTCSSLPKS